MQMFEAQGMRMPKLGLGTWQLQGAACRDAVASALSLGYRHLDTAEMYENEAEVAAGIAASGVPRDQIHITSKVSPQNLQGAAMNRAVEESLKRLNTDYLDLYLIHWPSPGHDMRPALEQLTQIQTTGKVRAIGVSNFPVALMRVAVEEAGAPIVCNQVEYHPLLDQSAILAYARRHNICVAAYSPLARGQVNGEPHLAHVARKHNVTETQIALAWLVEQPNVAALPKAAGRAHQQANLDALTIRLDDEDRATIAQAPKNRRLISPPWAPVWDAPAA